MYKLTQEQMNMLLVQLNEMPHKYVVGMFNVLSSLEKIEPKTDKPKK